MNRGQDLILAIVILALVYVLSGCAGAPVKPAAAPDTVQNSSMQCPPDDVLFMTGAGPVGVPKGFFDSGEGANWMRMREYQRLVDDAQKAGGL